MDDDNIKPKVVSLASSNAKAKKSKITGFPWVPVEDDLPQPFEHVLCLLVDSEPDSDDDEYAWFIGCRTKSGPFVDGNGVLACPVPSMRISHWARVTLPE